LIFTQRHTRDFLTITEDERRETNDLVRVLTAAIAAPTPAIAGIVSSLRLVRHTAARVRVRQRSPDALLS
jgi:hypothetical protein